MVIKYFKKKSLEKKLLKDHPMIMYYCDKLQNKDEIMKWITILYQRIYKIINDNKQIDKKIFYEIIENDKLDSYMEYYLLELIIYLGYGKDIKKEMIELDLGNKLIRLNRNN